MAYLDLAEMILRDPEARFVVLGLRSDLGPEEREEFARLFHELGSQRCWTAARKYHVSALVATSVVSRLPRRVTQVGPWRQFVAKNEKRVRALLEHLGVLFRMLDEEGVRAAVIEAGGVLIATQLPLSGYGSGDVDILVEAGRRQAVAEAMKNAGFRLVQRKGRHPGSRGEYRKLATDGTELWVAVGFRAFDRVWGPYPCSLAEEAWLARRVRGRRYPSLWVLDDTDLLVQVAVHTATHSYLRAPGLRLHVDVDRVVRHCQVEWTSFLSQVRAGQCAMRAAVSLWLASQLLGTPVPRPMLAELWPSTLDQTRLVLPLYLLWALRGTPLERWVAAGVDAASCDDGPARWFVQALRLLVRSARKRVWLSRLFDVLTRYER